MIYIYNKLNYVRIKNILLFSICLFLCKCAGNDNEKNVKTLDEFKKAVNSSRTLKNISEDLPSKINDCIVTEEYDIEGICDDIKGKIDECMIIDSLEIDKEKVKNDVHKALRCIIEKAEKEKTGKNKLALLPKNLVKKICKHFYNDKYIPDSIIEMICHYNSSFMSKKEVRQYYKQYFSRLDNFIRTKTFKNINNIETSISKVLYNKNSDILREDFRKKMHNINLGKISSYLSDKIAFMALIILNENKPNNEKQNFSTILNNLYQYYRFNSFKNTKTEKDLIVPMDFFKKNPRLNNFILFARQLSRIAPELAIHVYNSSLREKIFNFGRKCVYFNTFIEDTNINDYFKILNFSQKLLKEKLFSIRPFQLSLVIHPKKWISKSIIKDDYSFITYNNDPIKLLKKKNLEDFDRVEISKNGDDTFETFFKKIEVIFENKIKEKQIRLRSILTFDLAANPIKVFIDFGPKDKQSMFYRDITNKNNIITHFDGISDFISQDYSAMNYLIRQNRYKDDKRDFRDHDIGDHRSYTHSDKRSNNAKFFCSGGHLFFDSKLNKNPYYDHTSMYFEGKRFLSISKDFLANFLPYIFKLKKSQKRLEFLCKTEIKISSESKEETEYIKNLPDFKDLSLWEPLNALTATIAPLLISKDKNTNTCPKYFKDNYDKYIFK